MDPATVARMHQASELQALQAYDSRVEKLETTVLELRAHHLAAARVLSEYDQAHRKRTEELATLLSLLNDKVQHMADYQEGLNACIKRDIDHLRDVTKPSASSPDARSEHCGSPTEPAQPPIVSSLDPSLFSNSVVSPA